MLLAAIFTSSASAATKHINEKSIKSYIQKHKGIVGVYYENTTNNDSFQYQATKVTRAASTIKLPLVTYVMEQASKGKVDLNKKLTYHSYEYNEGSGIIQYDKVGTKYTIRTLVKYAVVYSDNIAFVMLRNYVGKSNFIAYCKSLGGKHLYENGVNVTTAKDMEAYMKYFQKFSQSHNLGKELEGYLTKTIYNDYIPKGIPKNVTIAHKVGMIPESNIYNDVAIVKDKHPYILVILTKDKKGPTIISGLSEIIHQEHIKANKEIKTSALK
ncbi:serine hydrolase [Niallia nealsonii]|uniref:serine hydrolase n=1 Tax=Niallia nealsonii TaxID=115979 RepID=UPI0012FF596E|nr:serine hydrolase [Niallia nealsonii]